MSASSLLRATVKVLYIIRRSELPASPSYVQASMAVIHTPGNSIGADSNLLL